MRFTREEINFLIAWAQEYSRIVPRGRALALVQEHHVAALQISHLLFAAFVAGAVRREDIVDGPYDENPVWPWASYEQFGIRVQEAEESVRLQKAELWRVTSGLSLN